MVYFSLILSLTLLYFVVLQARARRGSGVVSGLMIAGMLACLLLDVDTLVTGRQHPSVTFLRLGVLILSIITMKRARE